MADLTFAFGIIAVFLFPILLIYHKINHEQCQKKARDNLKAAEEELAAKGIKFNYNPRIERNIVSHINWVRLGNGTELFSYGCTEDRKILEEECHKQGYLTSDEYWALMAALRTAPRDSWFG